MVDAIFDIFYSFFPLIIRKHYSSKSLLFFSSFQSYSFISFLSMIIPLIFLSTKMFTILNYLSNTARKDWRLLFDERMYNKMRKELNKIDPHRADSLSQLNIKIDPRISAMHWSGWDKCCW